MICLERRRLKSKAGGGSSKEVERGAAKKAKIGIMAKSEKYVLWC